MKHIYFIHIPKTAGQSIKREFRIKYLLNEIPTLYHNPRSKSLFPKDSEEYKITIKVRDAMQNNLITTSDMTISLSSHRNIYDEIKDVNPRFSFAFVRNPWDRLVSLYSFLKKIGILNTNVIFGRFVKTLYDNRNYPENFDDTQLNVPTIELKKLLSVTSQCQANFICNTDGNLFADFVGKYENLQSDFDKVCDLIEIDHINLTRINVSVHKQYQQYYTTETKNMVNEMYKTDIDMFEYTF